MISLRYGLIFSGLVLPVSAWAQYAPFLPPGGLAPATMVGSQTLAQMQAATAGAIPAAQKGAAGGVAALDGGGTVTAPLTGDATDAAVTPAGGATTTLGAYLGTLAKSSDLSAYLTAQAASETYATLSALGETDSVAHAAQATAQAAVPSAALLDAQGRVMVPVVGDVTGAPVVPAGGSSVNLGTYLGTLATQAGLVAETSRATGAEAVLQGNIGTEAAARANADALLAQLSGAVFTGAVSVPQLNLGGDIYPSTVGGQYSAHYGPGSVWRLSFQGDGNLVVYDSGGKYIFTVGGRNDNMTVAVPAIFGAAVEVPTPAAGDNSSNVATTAGVRAEIASGYTVATLPSDGRRYVGARAYVTDATACNFMASPTGGGATFCPVICNGTAWIAE
ncbi:hypothetical protein HLH44_05735 [Gluconacetobacter sp. 1c LMG 22058]|uniref:Uncharacterized protein n=1 Tax=Gluconacetobacter dulcium TaxID=2729096 RepID=A0A7W4JYA6_9PROT|nr:hypothetical protein [Gluconacetobacter dulcium]MBB2196968.1 hypothetical protein [Gluconacetobacter dulcium]